MKKQLFSFALIIFLFLSENTSAQLASSGNKYLGNDGSARFFELYDTEGNRIKTAEEMGVNGTPMLREGWAAGKIRFKNGQTTIDTALNFSLFDKMLYCKRDNRYIRIITPVESFSLTYTNEDGDPVNYHFKTGFPVVNDRDPNSLYEVLYEGENLQLIQWDHKKIRDVYTYGSGREREFALDQQLYVYIPKDKTMMALKQALPSIKKTLPAYADIIAAYVSKHGTDVKDKADMIDLIAYLDKHK